MVGRVSGSAASGTDSHSSSAKLRCADRRDSHPGGSGAGGDRTGERISFSRCDSRTAATTGTPGRNSCLPTRRAIPNSVWASSGIWISGASTAAPPEAARDQLLAEDWARQEVVDSLVAERRLRIFHVARPGPAARDLAGDAGLRSRFPATHAVAFRSWRHVPARRASGRAVGICRFRRHSHSREADPAAGKPDQHSAGRKSRGRRTRAGPDGAATLTGSSRRITVIAAGTPAGHP